MPLGNQEFSSAPFRGGANYTVKVNLGTVTGTTQSDFGDLIGYQRRTIVATNSGSVTGTFTIQGSPDNSNWDSLGYGVGSTTGYTKAARTLGTSTTEVYYLATDDYARYVRVNVTGSAGGSGIAFNAYATRD